MKEQEVHPEILWMQGQMQQMNDQKELSDMERAQMQKAYQQASMFGAERQDNLIQWQLDLNEELDRIEHLLRGEKLKYDQQGNLFWEKQTELEIFNDYGVQILMHVISFYLNRNTILSNYDEQMINWKMKDFGDELADLIFLKYEKIFAFPSQEECIKILESRIKERRERALAYKKINPDINLAEEKAFHITKEDIDVELDNIRYEIIKDKLKFYPMIVREIVDTVHSSYLRSLNGGERDSLRKSMFVNQSANPQIPTIAGGMGLKSPNKFSLLKPSTWI